VIARTHRGARALRSRASVAFFFCTLTWLGRAVADDAPARAPVVALLHDGARLDGWLGAHSPELRAAQARVAQSSAEARASRLLQNPVLDASLSNVPLGETNPPGLTFDETAIYSVGISQTIELGKRGPRIAAADLRHRSAGLQLAASRRDALSGARLALANALRRALRLAILEGSLKDAERAAELERTRYEQKALSGTDYDRLLLDLTSLRADLGREQSEYRAALADCAAALGADCDLQGARAEDLEGAVPIAADTSAVAGLERRPALMALEAERRAAERDADLARARAIPDLTLRLGYTHDRFVISGDNPNTLSVGLALPVPLFDRGQHDASKALGRADELRETRAAQLLADRAQLSGLLSRKATLEKTLADLKHDSLPRSSSVLQSTQQAFDHGGVSLTDLILARRTQVALELNLLDQRFELFGIRNALQRLLGAPHGTPENQT
jgi:cobalt-zinc-cadmium efflux system outer membrane protein